MTAVSLENVRKLYNKVPVVNDLSFTIKSGEMFGLLSPNGAVKSTTIRMLTTLTKPSEGQIEVAEYLCGSKAVAPLAHRIGIMDAGQLIELGTLEQLRSKHGEGLVMKQQGDRWEYKFFPNLEQANAYLDAAPDKTGMMVRPSNLEDIFVELTGRQLD